MKKMYSAKPFYVSLKNTGIVQFLVLCMSLVVSLSYLADGQDIQYSQFYANVLYLNPAFAGSAHGLRGVAQQRLQWPALDAKYISSNVSIDYYVRKTRSGIGLMFLKDWQGSNTISTTEGSLLLSQEVALSSHHFLRAGAQATYASRFINYSILTFPDQFNDDGPLNINSQEPFGSAKVKYWDFSVGTMFYSEKYWLGLSAHHINTPNQSFYGNGSPLPVKWAVIAGYKIVLLNNNALSKISSDNEIYITPTAHYKFQGKNDQVDVGIYALYYRLILGAWYRGIPLLKQYKKDIQNNESMVVLGGWKINNLRMSYSYDFTVSKLAKARTGGSHEINVTYVVEIQKKRKIMKKLPCPDF
jgi:type IX secretion system PorP/SprF family membrane protein